MLHAAHFQRSLVTERLQCIAHSGDVPLALRNVRPPDLTPTKPVTLLRVWTKLVRRLALQHIQSGGHSPVGLGFLSEEFAEGVHHVACVHKSVVNDPSVFVAIVPRYFRQDLSHKHVIDCLNLVLKPRGILHSANL